jgi:hypothetical protein
MSFCAARAPCLACGSGQGDIIDQPRHFHVREVRGAGPCSPWLSSPRQEVRTALGGGATQFTFADLGLGHERTRGRIRPNVGWHTFRHTYRTWLDSTGAPIAMQRELMRHASIETTMKVYGRAVMSYAKRQANSKVVQKALRPGLSTKAESGTSEKAPPLNAPLSSLAGGSQSTASV